MKRVLEKRVFEKVSLAFLFFFVFVSDLQVMITSDMGSWSFIYVNLWYLIFQLCKTCFYFRFFVQCFYSISFIHGFCSHLNVINSRLTTDSNKNICYDLSVHSGSLYFFLFFFNLTMQESCFSSRIGKMVSGISING